MANKSGWVGLVVVVVDEEVVGADTDMVMCWGNGLLRWGERGGRMRGQREEEG